MSKLMFNQLKPYYPIVIKKRIINALYTEIKLLALYTDIAFLSRYAMYCI